ncbi:MAG: hypothetical protein WBN68_13655 [Sedimenticolaceae bacterium]
MFRNLGSLILAGALTSAAYASDLDIEPCINGGVSSRGDYATQAMEDHIKAQLDWRSYYLDRMAASRVEKPRDEASVEQAPAAVTN